jgi:acetyl coenzyme A synthetase (ADP forming)-like protein
MRVLAPSPPATDDMDARRLVLRDGSTATVRATVPGDREAMQRFFNELSPESHYRRFLTKGEPSDALIDRFCNSSDLSQALTLVACREDRFVAVASYIALTGRSAEVAFAVDDRFQGRGISTLLLERLAAFATANGFERFHATTQSDNVPMLDVFRESGFEVRSKSDRGCIDLQWSLTPSPAGVASAERRRRLATIASIEPLLAPRAVAVIGASRDPGKIGSRILRALSTSHFTGQVHVVHPDAVEIQGVPACRSARDLPAGVDMAVIAVPAASVPALVDDCAAAGVKSLVVISAGFAETGPDGRAAQDALVDKVRGHGMRMVGPNCMGLLNLDPDVRLNASFSPVVPPAGGVAFSSQSGALGIAILGMAGSRHLGLSAFVSVGNKADVSSNDLLEYWEEDPRTRVILLYLESFGNPRRFARIARRVGRTKPIVALKAGRTRAGSRAAGSHTAALAASDVAVEALLHQSGVIRVDTVDELFDVAVCLDAQPLPKGRRVAVVTNAGGPGILATDACEAAGLSVTEFTGDTCTRLSAFLPKTASVANPIDMVAAAGPDDYRRAIAIALAAPETDALIVIFTPVDAPRADAIIEGIRAGIIAGRASGDRDKPVFACISAESLGSAPLKAGDESIPTFVFPERAIRALGKVANYAGWRSAPAGLFWSFDDIHVEEAQRICRQAIAARGGGWLTTGETSAVLHAFGVPTAVSAVAHSPDEAVALASVMGFPVAAKLASASVLHKSELGAVRLNLATAQDVRKAFTEILARAGKTVPGQTIDGVLIQSMVPDGIEMIAGITHDPVFGPLVGFGMGGIDVEVFRDVRFRVAPLTDRDADELLHEIRGIRLLQGHRGRPPADLDALRDILLRVSRLAEDVREIAELDLNPVMVLDAGKGCRVVDARIRVSGHPNETVGIRA